MTLKLKSILPWRLQTFLGMRPARITNIETLERSGRVKVNNIHFKAGIDKITYPAFLGDQLHPHFQSITIEKIQKHCSSYYCAEIKNASFLDIGNICTILAGHSIIRELSFDPVRRDTHPALTIYNYPPSTKLEGKSLVLSTLGANHNYFHWTLDLCQKVGFIQACGYKLSDFDHILINEYASPYQKEWIKMLNLPEDKLMLTKADAHYKLSLGVIPSYSPHSYFGFSFIREKALSLLPTSKRSERKNIYVSRNKVKGRNVVNETEVLNSLKEQNFHKVYLEDLSIMEQVALFNNANWIIMPHGAAMTNVIFCQSKTMLIELHDKDTPLNTDFFPYINYVGIHYGYILCDNVANPETEHFNFRNLLVDTIELRQLIDSMDRLKSSKMSHEY